MSSPGVDPGTFRCHAAALTTRSTLLCIFPSHMVHISQTCLYLSIYVYTRAYACVCVHLHLTSQSRARMTRICPCVDWGTTPADSVAGYWQLVTDTSNMNRYEQDMCTSVSVQICYVQVRICSNLWR